MLNCFACVHPINLKRDCVFSAFSLDAWSGVDWLLAKEVGFGGRIGSIRRLRSKFATIVTASSLYQRRSSFEDRVPSENQEIPKQKYSSSLFPQNKGVVGTCKVYCLIVTVRKYFCASILTMVRILAGSDEMAMCFFKVFTFNVTVTGILIQCGRTLQPPPLNF